MNVIEMFFARRIGGIEHIPRIWFPHQDGAASFVSFLKHDNELNGLKEVWISTVGVPSKRASSKRDTNDDDPDDREGGRPSLISLATRLELPVAEARLKQATEFWEARGVTVVVKTW